MLNRATDLTPLAAAESRRIRRAAIGIALYAGVFGATFGAVAATAHLSLPQILMLSGVMFTGASQFAFVEVPLVGRRSPGSLLWPQLRGRQATAAATLGGVVALALLQIAPAGVPVVAAAGAAILLGITTRPLREAASAAPPGDDGKRPARRAEDEVG